MKKGFLIVFILLLILPFVSSSQKTLNDSGNITCGNALMNGTIVNITCKHNNITNLTRLQCLSKSCRDSDFYLQAYENKIHFNRHYPLKLIDINNTFMLKQDNFKLNSIYLFDSSASLLFTKNNLSYLKLKYAKLLILNNFHLEYYDLKPLKNDYYVLTFNNTNLVAIQKFSSLNYNLISSQLLFVNISLKLTNLNLSNNYTFLNFKSYTTFETSPRQSFAEYLGNGLYANPSNSLSIKFNDDAKIRLSQAIASTKRHPPVKFSIGKLSRPVYLTYLHYNVAHFRGNAVRIKGFYDTTWNFLKICSKSNLINNIDNIASFIENTRADIVSLNEVDFNSKQNGIINTESFNIDTIDQLLRSLNNKNSAITKAIKVTKEVKSNLYFSELKPTNIYSTILQNCPDYKPSLFYNSHLNKRVWRYGLDIGNAMLTRFDIVDNAIYRPTIGPVFSITTLNIYGIPVKVIITHFDDKNARLKYESKTIVDLINRYTQPNDNIILSGDLNINPPPISKLKVPGTNLAVISYFEKNGFKTRYNEKTYSSTRDEQILDYIMIRGPNLKFEDYNVKDVKFSDHKPIVARIKMTP